MNPAGNRLAFGACELGLLQNTTAFPSEAAIFPPGCGGRKEQKTSGPTVAVKAWRVGRAPKPVTPLDRDCAVPTAVRDKQKKRLLTTRGAFSPGILFESLLNHARSFKFRYGKCC